MATPLDTLFFEITVKAGPGSERVLAQFTTQAKAANKATRDMTTSTNAYTAASGRATASAVTLQAALRRLMNMFGGLLVIRSVTRAMIGFDTRMAEISTIATGGAAQMDLFRKATMALTKELPQSAEELGAGIYQILSANIKDSADVLSVLEASAKVAVAGLTNTATAVETVVTVLNAFELQASEATRVTDVMFKTVEYGLLKFPQLASELGTAVTSAALAGATIEELGAAIAVITQKGVSAAETTTALNRFFITLTRHTKDQEDAFRALGVEFTIEAVKAKGLASVLGELNKLTAGQIDAISELFPNIRAARAAFILLGNGADEFRKILDIMHHSQGAAQEAFEKMNNTVYNQARIFKNNLLVVFQEVMISIAPGLISFFQKLTGWIQNFVGGIKVMAAEWTVTVQQLEILGEKLMVALGRAITWVFDTLADTAESIRDKFISIAAVLPGTIGEAARVAAAAAGALAGPTREIARNAERGANHWQQQVNEAEKFLVFLKQAVEEEKLQIVTESDFARLRQEYLRQQQEAMDAMASAHAKSAEELQTEEALQKELARTVRRLTLTSAEQQRWMLDDLKKRWIDAFGSISESAQVAFDAIENAVEAALRKERAEELAESFKEVLERKLQDLEIETLQLEFETDEERQQYILDRRVAIYEELKDAVQYMLQTAELTTEEESALLKIVVDLVKELRSAGDEQKRIGTEAERDARHRLQESRRFASTIRDAANATLDLASNFGLVNEELTSAVHNIEQLVIGVEQMAAGVSTGDIASMVSGGLNILAGATGLIGGLFGKSPEEQRREEVQKENTKALKELTRQIGEFGKLDLPGVDFSRYQQVADRFLEALHGGIRFTAALRSWAELNKAMQELDLTIEDMIDIGKQLGITFADEAKPTFTELRQVMEAIAATEFTQFARTFQGQLEALRVEFQLFDITDPLEQLERLRDVFTDPAFGAPALREALAGLDLSTAEGRRMAEQNIQNLFRMLQTGMLTPEQLGGLSGRDFLDALARIEELLDETATGVTQEVRRDVSITELQADQLLAYQSTLVYRAEERNILLQDILSALTGNVVGVAPPVVTGGVGYPSASNINIQVGPNSFTVGAGAGTPESIVDEISRGLGERLRDRKIALGA